MIDLHTHILPQMDDGSASLKETYLLLKRLEEQGVTTVCATPHFYADREYPESFFSRRDDRYQKILPLVDALGMEVRLGAEVKYYTGMEHTDLSDFLITDTNLLLLEMPFCPWTDRLLETARLLNETYQVVFAHIERYLEYQSRRMVRELTNSGIYLQTNASALLNPKTNKGILKRIKKGEITFLASDTHNMTSRPPKLSEADSILRKKLSDKTVREFYRRGNDAFYHAQIYR